MSLRVMKDQMQLLREQMRQQEERHKQREESNEERHKQQFPRPDAATNGRHPDGRRYYGTTTPDAAISSFRLYYSAMKGLPATLRDVVCT